MALFSIFDMGIIKNLLIYLYLKVSHVIRRFFAIEIRRTYNRKCKLLINNNILSLYINNR